MGASSLVIQQEGRRSSYAISSGDLTENDVTIEEGVATAFQYEVDVEDWCRALVGRGDSKGGSGGRERGTPITRHLLYSIDVRILTRD